MDFQLRSYSQSKSHRVLCYNSSQCETWFLSFMYQQLWDLATGSLLTTFLFPHPIDTLAVDVSETILLAAGHHNIYQVDLYKRVEERSYAATSIESVGGMGKVESIGLESSPNSKVFRGHT